MSGRYNNGGRYNNKGNNGDDDGNTKFCAVCSSAGRADFNTHYVRADKFDRNSKITCPYLLSIQCRTCGGNGHTTSYCKFNKSSDAGAVAPRTDSSRPSHLTPISSSHAHAPPRIVFETKPNTDTTKSAFPINNRSGKNLTLPSLLPLSRLQSVRNDEPLLRRGPPEASPVHSPAPKHKQNYNKRSNPFAALASSSDSENSDYYSPVAVASSPEGVGRCRKSSGASSWASVVTASPLHLPRFAPRQLPPLALAAPLPPPVFKARENAKPRDKKKLWGDSDSEDDEEFLKRGFEQNN